METAQLLRWALYAILLLAVIGLYVSLRRADRDGNNPLALRDLLLGDDGRMSRSAFVLLGSFLATTWTMLYLLINGSMTEGYFLAYGGMWVTPATVKLIKDKQPEYKT